MLCETFALFAVNFHRTFFYRKGRKGFRKERKGSNGYFGLILFLIPPLRALRLIFIEHFFTAKDAKVFAKSAKVLIVLSL